MLMTVPSYGDTMVVNCAPLAVALLSPEIAEVVGAATLGL